jgi:hypothetical protein
MASTAAWLTPVKARHIASTKHPIRVLIVNLLYLVVRDVGPRARFAVADRVICGAG